MPLVRIDVIKGRTALELQKLADTLHDCIVQAFEVPHRDRFQIVTEHTANQMIIQDVGLGFERSDGVVVVQITTTPRSLTARKAFYQLAAERLHQKCGLLPDDLMMNFVETSESNWSFGRGEAQFLTGAL